MRNEHAAFSIFQFHKGTIKAYSRCCKADAIGNFNSIKVQLKHGKSISGLDMERFQFHKGTIKAMTMNNKVTKHLANFNSIKVQLKRCIAFRAACRIEYFNSIKVQLKQYGIKDVWGA